MKQKEGQDGSKLGGYGERSGASVRVTHLDEGVDSHDGHVWLRLCIVHEVQVNQLLQLEVVGLHAVDDIWEEGRHVLADGHAGNDLLHRFLLFLLLVIVELRFQLEDLALFGGREVFRVSHPVVRFKCSDPKIKAEKNIIQVICRVCVAIITV